MLACELVGTHLAEWLGLPPLEHALVRVTPQDELPLAGRDIDDSAVSRQLDAEHPSFRMAVDRDLRSRDPRRLNAPG